MYGLLFPAVLGTLFVLFVSKDLIGWQFGPRSAFAFVFISHWCFEFVLAGDEKHLASYSWLEFAGDFSTIVIMYGAFDALPQRPEAGRESYADFQCVYVWVFMLPVAFLLVDVLRQLAEGQTLRRAIVRVDVWVLFATGFFMVLGCMSAPFRQSEAAFYLFTAVVFGMSVWSFRARKDRLGFEGQG